MSPTQSPRVAGAAGCSVAGLGAQQPWGAPAGALSRGSLWPGTLHSLCLVAQEPLGWLTKRPVACTPVAGSFCRGLATAKKLI